MKLYQAIAQAWQARENCERMRDREKDHCAGNYARHSEWMQRHGDRVNAMVKQHMPSGSGFDNGTTLDYGATRPNRLVFNTAFHHMDEHGSYDGWSQHQVIVTPCLVSGFDLRVTGRNRRDIKDYIAECFHIALNSEIARTENDVQGAVRRIKPV